MTEDEIWAYYLENIETEYWGDTSVEFDKNAEV